MFRRTLIFSLFFLVAQLCFAAHEDYMFKHLEAGGGLSDNQVTAIFKDSKGFMWFGTASGLNRFDGYEMKVYRGRMDDGSLPDNYVDAISEDASGNLWVHTPSGYAVYDMSADSFDCNMVARLAELGIEGEPELVHIDGNKDFWIYVAEGGLYFHSKEGGVAKVSGVESEILGGGAVTDIVECAGIVVLVFDNGKLFGIDKGSLDVLWSEDRLGRESGGRLEVYSLFVDDEDCLWIYSVLGLWKYRLPQREWLSHSLRKGGFDVVRTMAQDSEGAIWLGKDRGGIEIIEKSGQSHNLLSDMSDARALHDDTISTLFADETGTVWVGTYKTGVYLYNESIFKFAIDNVGDINCVEEDPDGGLWLGTNGDGLLYWNRNTGVKRSFTHASSSIPSDVVVCMLRDRRGRLWLGTFWGGLTCYSGGRFTNYNQVRTEDGTVPLENVWSLAEDGQGNLWLGTLGGGLICFNPDTGNSVRYNKANSGIASDYVMSLCFDHSGTLVIGTSLGVSFLNPVTKTVGGSPSNGAGEDLSEVKYVVQVYEDSRNMLWLATRTGLYVYSSGTLYNVPVESDLSKFIFLGIAEDINKNIWVSTGGDLINIVPVMDIKGGKPYFNCYSYNEWDGLQLCNFNQRSLRSLRSGEVVAGGLYGLTRFRPDRIRYNRVLPKVMFSGFRLFDEEVAVGQSYDGNVILRKTLNEADSEVRLEYRQNVFTVRFASDDYVMPDKTRYFYKLDGFSDGWLATGAGLPRVTYTNLSPGTYCLRVRATNGDGYAGSEEAELRIVIMPPWWRTTAAYICYALLFALLLFLAFLFIRRREQHRFRLRQMEQDAIKTEELNQLKFKFFTNVSHELRTPLTLIISPLESLLAETTDVGLREKLGRMQRNAVRLLNLVNQLLDFRKNSETDVHLNLFEGDIVMFVRNICNSFLTLSERQDMHLTFFSAMESLDMQFDEDKFGKIVTNLLSNAFKFTPSGGRVDVSLDCPSTDLFELKVSDTGVGISDEDKEHIFDRFYRVENEDNHTTGSGIGLSLVHDFVTLHNGSVRVLDNAGGGSVFVVTIPIRHSASYVAAKPEAAADEGQEAVVGQDRPVALFVDDNADLVSFMKDSLGLYFRVQTASNGREAWEMIRRSAPDVVVCDVMMPEMDGNELCRLVKSDQLTAHIPFILLTAKQSLENKLEGLTLGADDYVTKPFNVEVLILRMRKLIELSGGRRSRSRIEPEPEPIVITSMDEKLVEKAIRKVEENISNPDFSVEALSRELGMSRVQLYKKLLRITGKTPVEFIRVIRLKRAVQFLRESQLNVSEVAYRVGFNNPRYFTKYFKEEFGVLPSAFQYKETKK